MAGRVGWSLTVVGVPAMGETAWVLFAVGWVVCLGLVLIGVRSR